MPGGRGDASYLQQVERARLALVPWVSDMTREIERRQSDSRISPPVWKWFLLEIYTRIPPITMTDEQV